MSDVVARVSATGAAGDLVGAEATSAVSDPTPLQRPEDGATHTALASGLACLPSTTLLRGRSVVQIEHNGALYQLRNTRQGKLILTK
jgi:hemin uptake protein HemP